MNVRVPLIAALVALTGLAGAAPAPAVPASSPTATFYLSTFPGLETEALAHVDGLSGIVLAHEFHHWSAILVVGPTAYEGELAAIPGVQRVEVLTPAAPAMDVSTRAVRIVAEPGLVADGVNHSLAVHDTLGLRGEGMVIAILDTGIDNSHAALDDLDDNPATFDPKLVHKIDPQTGDLMFASAMASQDVGLVGCVNPLDEADEYGGHGTRVAAIAAGTSGLIGSPGAAPAAQLVEVALSKGLPDFLPPEAILPLAFEWILDFNAGTSCFQDPGNDTVDILNLSWGWTSDGDPHDPLNRMLTDVARSGITVVKSAGNNGPGSGTVAGTEGAILVAASKDFESIRRDDDLLARYSSRGPRNADGDGDTIDELRPDIAAPGTRIGAPLSYSVVGDTIWTDCVAGPGGLLFNCFVVQETSGTSFAAPHVAGVAALMLQAAPCLQAADFGSNEAMGDVGAVPVRDLLIQTAQYKTATESGPPYVSQVGRFNKPWNSAWGYGLLDAYDAASAAVEVSCP